MALSSWQRIDIEILTLTAESTWGDMTLDRSAKHMIFIPRPDWLKLWAIEIIANETKKANKVSTT